MGRFFVPLLDVTRTTTEFVKRIRVIDRPPIQFCILSRTRPWIFRWCALKGIQIKRIYTSLIIRKTNRGEENNCAKRRERDTRPSQSTCVFTTRWYCSFPYTMRSAGFPIRSRCYGSQNFARNHEWRISLSLLYANTFIYLTKSEMILSERWWCNMREFPVILKLPSRYRKQYIFSLRV